MSKDGCRKIAAMHVALNGYKNPFRSTKRLSSLVILHIHGRKVDVEIPCVIIITWGSMPVYLRMTVCEYVMNLKTI